LSWHEEYYPSAKRAWKDGSELYTLMPCGKGEVLRVWDGQQWGVCTVVVETGSIRAWDIANTLRTRSQHAKAADLASGASQPGNAFRSLDAPSKKVPFNSRLIPYSRFRPRIIPSSEVMFQVFSPVRTMYKAPSRKEIKPTPACPP
jgi:hypothetical protein